MSLTQLLQQPEWEIEGSILIRPCFINHTKPRQFGNFISFPSTRYIFQVIILLQYIQSNSKPNGMICELGHYFILRLNH